MSLVTRTSGQVADAAQTRMMRQDPNKAGVVPFLLLTCTAPRHLRLKQTEDSTLYSFQVLN